MWVSQSHCTLSRNLRYRPSREGFGGDSTTNVREGRWVHPRESDRVAFEETDQRTVEEALEGTEPESDTFADGRAFDESLEGTEPESDDHADGGPDHGIASCSTVDEYGADVFPIDESFVYANNDDPTYGGTHERTISQSDDGAYGRALSDTDDEPTFNQTHERAVSQSDGKSYETSIAESDDEAHENTHAESDEEADQRPLGHSACQRGLVHRLGH